MLPTSQATQILERIASIGKSIQLPNYPGVGQVQSVYDTQPSDIPSANCPFIVIESANKPGAVLTTSGLQTVKDHLLLVLAVALRESEVALQVNLKNTLRWRDAVISTFAQHVQLSQPNQPGYPDLTNFVVSGLISDWVGPTSEVYGTAEFVVLKFGYTVTEHPYWPVAA